MNIDDKIKGMIMGLAIGDALGAPVECLSRNDIHKKYRKVTDYIEMPEKFNPDTRFSEGDYRIKGSYTDDTQLALALLESLIENKGFCPEKYARKLVELYPYMRGPGKSVRLAIHSLKEGATWDNSGRQDGFGNGAAIRIAPLGAYYRNNYPALKNKAVESAKITHTHPDVIASAVALAFSAAYAVNHEGFDPKDYLNEVSSFAEEISPAFSACLNTLPELLTIPTTEALERIGTKSAYNQSIPAAIYLFSKHHNDPASAVIHAINAGGDTDSVGAMTYALVSGCKGYKSIPEKWLSGLRNRKDIEERAVALTRGDPHFSRSLYEMEKELTLEERAARKKIRKQHKKYLRIKKREDKINEAKKATYWLVSQIPSEDKPCYFDINSFADAMIRAYIAREIPERYFSEFLDKVKQTSPQDLKEQSLGRLPGADLRGLPASLP